MTKGMKTAIILSALVVYTYIAPTSFAGSWNGWIYQDPYPTTNTLLTVKFVTPKIGWIAGEQGTIFYTADGGETWEAQESGTEQNLSSIYFVNEKIGWVVGEQGIIIHTEDSGKSWVTQTKTGLFLLKICFVNELQGWAVGRKEILHTTNGGKTWVRREMDLEGTINSIFFINPNAGWLLAGGAVYSTQSGGEKWDKITLPRADYPSFGPPGFVPVMAGARGDIYFTDEKNGWAVVGFSLIFHTTDGGKTWTNQLHTKSLSYGLSRLAFIDDARGCAGGSSLLCTEDGGATWHEKLGVSPGSYARINDFLVQLQGISFPNPDIGWSVGNDGQIWKTENGGKTWKLATRRDECGSEAFFINKKVGWLFGHVPSYATCISRTTDGGHSWEKQEVGIEVADMFFWDDLTGWVVGKKSEGKDINNPNMIYGVIKQTTDGGKTWSTQFKELMGNKVTEDGFFRVFFVNRKTGWAAGYKGTIMHTDDGGKNWYSQKKTPGLYLRNMWFINSNIGWMIGTVDTAVDWTGIILYTEDGGKKWNTQRRIEGTAMSGIYFEDSMNGWVTGKNKDESSRLYYTQDGGKTWIEKEALQIGKGYPLFHNKKQGVITSKKEWIILTTDGGNTWKKMRKPIRKFPWQFSEIFDINHKSK